MHKQPSLIKIITIDYISFTAFLFPVVLWGLYIFMFIFQDIDVSLVPLPVLFVAISIIAVAIIGWRVHTFNTIFSDGIETTAVISNVSFFRDRGRIEYAFTYQGQKFASGNAVHKVRLTQMMRVGQQVIMVVDRNNPKRAYIRDLYM